MTCGRKPSGTVPPGSPRRGIFLGKNLLKILILIFSISLITFGLMKASPVDLLQFASISEIFGGSILAEQVFSYPGLGQAAVAAGLGSDMPLLMGITIVSVLFVFGGNLAADILYTMIDPRMRRGGGTK